MGLIYSACTLAWLIDTEQFSFDEEFDVFLKELAKASDGKEDVSVVSSRLITFHDLKNKGAKDGYSLRTLPLSKLSSRYTLSPATYRTKILNEPGFAMASSASGPWIWPELTVLCL